MITKEDLLQKKMAEKFYLGAGFSGGLKLHPEHFCRSIRSKVMYRIDRFIRVRKDTPEVMKEALVEAYHLIHDDLLSSLAYMAYLHHNLGVEVAPHEEMPILRVCALHTLWQEHLLRYVDLDLDAILGFLEGSHDSLLIEDKLPPTPKKEEPENGSQAL